jgi:hypothetical protein
MHTPVIAQQKATQKRVTMKNLRTPLLGLTAGVLLLAGCSNGSAADQTAVESSAQPSAAASDRPQGQMGFGGVSGEVVYAQDGVLQVQDESSQTAVRYTADTSVSERVTIALSDVSVGSCVMAVVGDDGSATTVTVSEPVDGECTTGFGQGGFPGGMGDAQAPDGTMPSGAPTDMPSGMPTAMPDGGGQGGFGGTFVTGTVASVSASGLTVTTDDGSSDVTVGADTTITGTQASDSSAIAVGMCLTAQGTADDSGGFDATSITLSVKGDDGCSTRGFGGMNGGMGRPGDQGSNAGSNG